MSSKDIAWFKILKLLIIYQINNVLEINITNSLKQYEMKYHEMKMKLNKLFHVYKGGCAVGEGIRKILLIMYENGDVISKWYQGIINLWYMNREFLPPDNKRLFYMILWYNKTENFSYFIGLLQYSHVNKDIHKV